MMLTPVCLTLTAGASPPWGLADFVLIAVPTAIATPNATISSATATSPQRAARMPEPTARDPAPSATCERSGADEPLDALTLSTSFL
jgi:hypothetical protein